MRQVKMTRDSFHVFQANARNALKQSEQVPSILICAGTGCIAGGAMKIYDNLKTECEKRGLPVYVGLKHDTDAEKSLHVKMSGCHGFCEMGPLVHIEPMGVMYIHVKPEDCHEILEKTVLGGEIIDRLVYHLDGVAYPRQEDIPFYKKQHRVVLENCGSSDAEDIEEYIAKGGYAGFEKALFEMTDEEICRSIIDSGLRGRGGGGFPAGQKWDGARKQKSEKKYIVCNGDEGDPGAFMDRSIMEGNPHSVLEGMMIAGRAVGSNEGYIYVRAEYPLAVSRLKAAIAKAEEYGLLGDHVMGTDFSFRIHVNTGTVSPGSTRSTSPTATCSAGMASSRPPVRRRAVWGVRCTSFSMPARARATVRSSSRAPSCMMKATSPAAKSSPMMREAIKAMDTSTSALMSKAVTRPMTASKMMGIPQRTTAAQAASKGSCGSRSKMLTSRAMPEKTRQVTAFFTPPHSRNRSRVWIKWLTSSLYTYGGICILYP